MDNVCLVRLEDIGRGMEEALGRRFTIRAVTKLAGGAQKVVYKVECEHSFSCILYVWDVTRSYFREETEEGGNTSYGALSFERMNRLLTEQGIRTPAMYYMNESRSSYPFDYALVETVEGPNAAFYFDADQTIKDTVFGRIGALVKKMHLCSSSTYGQGEGDRHEGHCHLTCLPRSESDLEYVAHYIDSISEHRSFLYSVLEQLSAAIRPRERYGLIHGELGPDHILLNDKLEPYLIDIEGGMFFDIEYEHSFLEFRFGDSYGYLRNDSIDSHRMKFYKLYHHISCTAGGLKLLHRGFPDKQAAQHIVDYNCASALKFARSIN